MATHRVNRRLTNQQAIRAILEGAGESSDEEGVFPSEEVVPAAGDMERVLDGNSEREGIDVDDDGDFEIFEEDDRRSASSADETSEEDQCEISPSGILYSREPPTERRRARNIINFEHRPRNLTHVSSELEALLLFLPEEQLRVILRHTNRKCQDVSR